MSVYIVDNETIERIINFLFWHRTISGAVHRTNLITKAGLGHDEESFEELGQAFFDMNTKAVNHRYNETEEAPIFVWTKNSIPSKIQALKSMQCLSYQCSEGTIVKSKLYKLLDNLISSLMSEIVSELPEYDKAEWK